MTKTDKPNWTPFETAPRDGTVFLAAEADGAPILVAWSSRRERVTKRERRGWLFRVDETQTVTETDISGFFTVYCTFADGRYRFYGHEAIRGDLTLWQPLPELPPPDVPLPDEPAQAA